MAVLIIIFLIFLNSKDHVRSSGCETKETCFECILSNSNCFWCLQKNYQNARCAQKQKLITNNCSQIENSHEFFKVISNRELSHVIVANENETVQVKPQQIFLRLKPNSLRHIKLTYRKTVDYPVDLYYLMDLSRTMFDHKRKLAQLGNELAIQMRQITKNFRLGFGSFVDKTTLPFSDSSPARLKKPCSLCAPTYGFINHMSLDINTSRFSKEVEENPISGNIDGPEGGFDALMQAIVCKKEIGWRKDARHLLIYASDATFHIAGDGKLGGLLEPNDAQCHLNSNHYYTYGNKQDYPSISQINLAAQANNVHIIFAILGPKIEEYRRLSQRIKSSSTAQLTHNSSNIVEIIKKEYQKLTSNVELTDNSTDYIKLNYFSSCLEKNKKLKNTNICSGLQVDSQVEFDIKIKIISCPIDVTKHNLTIKIHPIGLREGLIIFLEMICKCNCEFDKVKKPASLICNSRGTYECGVCSCNQASFGKNCECDLKNQQLVLDNQQCFENKNDTQPCSGRGNCICNQCVCHSTRDGIKYNGKFCQCEDYSCPFFEGQLCGGKNRGICKCGKCQCNKNFKGSSCECPLSQETCFVPNTSIVCNKKGICECGKCICNETLYTGQYCHQCLTCFNQCSTFFQIIKNQVDQKIKVIFQPKNFTSYLIEDDLTIAKDEKFCQILDQDECVYSFKYGYTTKKNGIHVVIKALKKKMCKKPFNVTKYVLTLIASFMMIGLITGSLWKLITYLIDQREYQKFIQSCKTANWSSKENPLFKPSTSTFYNPTYTQ